MGIVDAFNHAIENVVAKFKNYALFVGFITVVVFAFMVAMQAGELIDSISGHNFGLIGAKTLRIISADLGDPDKTELTMEDVDFLQKSQKEKDISFIYGFAQRTGEVKIGSQSAPCFVKGITPEFTEFSSVQILPGGKFIDNNDINVLKNVCVVNEKFAEKYFKKYEIVGETISINLANASTEKFRVIGVMKNDKFFIGDINNEAYFSEIYIPLSVATRFFGSKYLSYIEAKVKTSSMVDTVAERVAKLLEFKHGEDNSVFVVKKRIDVIDAQNQVASSSGLLVIAMGLISVLIGYLGIQNYMNLVIKFRAQEIAIRKVLGALKHDISLQFQLEVIIITGIGGIGGIFLGILFGVAQFFLFGYGSIINFGAIFMTLLVTLMLGVAGGYYPSKKAIISNIVPNMRHE